MLMILLSALSVIRQQLWQQLELASELESDLRDTVNWAGSGLLIQCWKILNWFRLNGLITLTLLM